MEEAAPREVCAEVLRALAQRQESGDAEIVDGLMQTLGVKNPASLLPRVQDLVSYANTLPTN